ncbi:MAG: DinB family protein [Anaerolineales bacterium]|nr:DinB family protein [Anaerolineales bacterium]
MSGRRETLLKRLGEEGEKTIAFFSALSEAQLQQPVYADGPQWRVRDLLAHLALVERTFHHFNEDVLNGGPGVPTDFDIDGFNAAHTEEGRRTPVAVLLEQFKSARAQTVALVASMTDADLNRRAYHPFLGQTTLEQILKLLYRHAMLHERDARRALERVESVESRT